MDHPLRKKSTIMNQPTDPNVERNTLLFLRKNYREATRDVLVLEMPECPVPWIEAAVEEVIGGGMEGVHTFLRGCAFEQSRTEKLAEALRREYVSVEDGERWRCRCKASWSERDEEWHADYCALATHGETTHQQVCVNCGKRPAAICRDCDDAVTKERDRLHLKWLQGIDPASDKESGKTPNDP